MPAPGILIDRGELIGAQTMYKNHKEELGAWGIHTDRLIDHIIILLLLLLIIILIILIGWPIGGSDIWHHQERNSEELAKMLVCLYGFFLFFLFRVLIRRNKLISPVLQQYVQLEKSKHCCANAHLLCMMRTTQRRTSGPSSGLGLVSLK
jgi:hypothetical protein